MARFRFKLDSLLTVRRNAEQALQREIARQNRERVTLEDSLRMLQRQIADTKASLREGLTGSLDTANLRLHAASTMELMRQAQRLVLELAGVHRRLETTRAGLVEAARRRRAIEILKERRFAAWHADQSRQEDNMLDELAVTAAARTALEPQLAEGVR